jgi:uncharacterized membrane protein
MGRVTRMPAVALLVGIVALVAVSLTTGSAVAGHCADYPDGHRCTTSGYGLIVVSVASAVVALLIALTALALRLKRWTLRRP